jgi:enoyl-[acyl-carrier protein] reductase II
MAFVNNSRICQLCGIKYPLFLGPMMKISTATMVSAFSEAGGLGCLASAGMQENVFRDQIQKIRQQTDAPFAVNIPWTVPNSGDILRWCLEEDVEIIISSAGSPAKGLERVKSANKRVFQVVSNISQAKRAETLDLDGIITKGFESGGLNSLEAIATLPLVPMVVDSVSIPVIAAGGIGDGRGPGFRGGRCAHGNKISIERRMPDPCQPQKCSPQCRGH